MNIFTYFTKLAKRGIISFESKFGSPITPDQLSTQSPDNSNQYKPLPLTFQPTLGESLYAIFDQKTPILVEDGKAIRAGISALFNLTPNEEDHRAIIKACPLFLSKHPEGNSADFARQIQNLELAAKDVLKTKSDAGLKTKSGVETLKSEKLNDWSMPAPLGTSRFNEGSMPSEDKNQPYIHELH